MWWSYRIWNCKKAKISHRFNFSGKMPIFKYKVLTFILDNLFLFFLWRFCLFCFFRVSIFFRLSNFFQFCCFGIVWNCQKFRFFCFNNWFGFLHLFWSAGSTFWGWKFCLLRNKFYFSKIFFWKQNIFFCEKSRAKIFRSSKIWKGRRLIFFLNWRD